MQPKKAIIIGSGIAGMAIAIRLALQGKEVIVYEKNPGPGGKLTAFEQEGYFFDAGPSLFTQPQNIAELFSLAGEPLDQYFQYKPVPVACTYFFENGKKITAYTDAAQFASELKEQAGEPETNVHEYLKNASELYDAIGTVFLDHSLHKKTTWLHKRVLKALSALKLAYLTRSLNSFNSSRFQSPETIQIFNRFATYNGSNPFRAPAMLSMIPHLEQNQGTFYPQGGMISITQALHSLASKKGVQFHFNTPVQRIIHHEGKVKGVVVNDENVLSDLVISNADAYFTSLHLLGDEAGAKKILRQERSSSAMIFYWGIKKTFPQLGLHNIFFSSDYAQEFKHIFSKTFPGDDPTVYINITSKMEAGHAPAGGENWFVMVNMPAHKGQDWNSIREKVRSAVITKLNRLLDDDISAHVQTESVLDPSMIEAQTLSYMGSLYGTSSNSRMAAFLRHPNFSSHISGLYFCGGSVHPGGGIPLCLKSAGIVSGLIQNDFSH